VRSQVRVFIQNKMREATSSFAAKRSEETIRTWSCFECHEELEKPQDAKALVKALQSKGADSGASGLAHGAVDDMPLHGFCFVSHVSWCKHPMMVWRKDTLQLIMAIVSGPNSFLKCEHPKPCGTTGDVVCVAAHLKYTFPAAA
jgi:uncharacterized CHY-type Zn-finger protein